MSASFFGKKKLGDARHMNQPLSSLPKCHCDRCKQLVFDDALDGVVIVESKSAASVTPYRLCKRCVEGLSRWLSR